MGNFTLMNKKILSLMLLGIVFSLTISISYILKILSIGIILSFAILPFLICIFLINQELTLLALVAAYFGIGYIFPDFVIQGLIRGLFLFLIILTLLLKSGATKKVIYIKNPLNRLLIFWLIVVFAAFIYGFLFEHNKTKYLVGDLYKFVEIILIFWLTTFIVKSNKEVKFLIGGFFIMVVVLGIIDSWVFFEQAQLVKGALEARVRAGAQFSSIFALVIAISLVIYEKRRGIRIALGFLILYFFITFLFCFLRTGYIALLLTLLFLFILYLYKENKHSFLGVRKIFSLIVFLVFFIGLFNLILTKINPDVDIIRATIVRFSSLINPGSNNPMGVRPFEIKSIISQVLVKKPLLGKGLGGEYYSFSGFSGSYKWILKHYVHNNYFDFIIRTGIIGLIIFVLLAFKYLKDAMSFYLKSKNSFYKGILLGCIGIFVSSCIIAFSCSIFYSPFLFIIMAMTYCVAYFEEKENRLS